MPACPKCHGNRGRRARLWRASKYGGDRGIIKVSLTLEKAGLPAEFAGATVPNGGAKGREAGWVKLTVADTGLGFEPKDREKFFQKFSRGDNAKSVHVNKSTGLGLYIVRKFIEAHGGEIFAESEGLGRGSKFGFLVPNQENFRL